MASYLTRIKAFLVPPVFPDDEDKTRTAGVLNTLLLAMMLFLPVIGGVLVPFVFAEKLYSGLVFAAAFLIFALAYRLMRRGRVRLAIVVHVCTLWVILTVCLSFAGGMTSIVAVFYVTATVVAGLLLGTRAALVHAAACSLAGLSMAILEASGHPLPRLFLVLPLAGWGHLTLSLLIATTVLSLVLRNLNEALALAHQQIEERKRAEESLRRRERDFSTLVENATDMIVRFDANLRHVYCNPAVERQLGTPVQMILGKTPLELGEPREQAEFIDRSLRMVLETGEEQRVEQSYPTPFGPKHFQTRIVPECGPSGRIESLLAITRDITDRKQVEEERELLLVQIRQQALKMEQILTTVPEGVFLLDTDGHVVMANPLAEEHLLTLAEAKVGDTLTHLGGRPLTELLTSPPTRGLWHEVATDGQRFQVIARSIESGTQPSGWVLVVHDVTQQRQAERYLQQQERLAALGQLAAGIAHDFNNIMAVITLYAGMSSRIPGLSPVVHDRLATIDQQARRASTLIQQILDFSRQAMLERGPLDLLTFLKEQVKLLQRTLPESIQITLTHDQDEDAAPLVVEADPTRIQQAVLNLATNARDAMPEGGRLRIGLERLQIADRQSAPLPEMATGEWARITVTDTGAGIPPDVLSHVFDPFFTTKAPGLGTGLGTGLGLSQVYGIVRQHEGQVDVRTQMGEGTTFILYLPALSVDRPEKPSAGAEPLPQGGGQIILMVEDEAVTRHAVAEGLKMLGYRVLEATNGQEALATFEQHSGEIDLVLTDLVMPEMGGQALFHALKQQDPAVKVLVMSGHPLNRQELEGLRAQGLGGWLPKPPSLEQLAQAVARVLEEGRCF